MRPHREQPDVEAIVLAFLKPLLAQRDATATIGVGVPATWSTDSPDHLQIELDGTPVAYPPIFWRSTVRCTGWSRSRTKAKGLASWAQAALLAHPGGDGISGCQFGTGVMVARDPDTRGLLGSTTTLVRVR